MDVSAVMHIFQAFAIYLYASIYQSVNQSIYLMLYICNLLYMYRYSLCIYVCI